MKTSIKKFVTELIKDDMSETIPNAKMCVVKHKGPKMGKKTAIAMPVITLFKNFSSCFYHFFTIFSR